MENILLYSVESGEKHAKRNSRTVLSWLTITPCTATI